MVRTKNPSASAATGASFIDITLRFKNDGGILFDALSRISAPYARAERVRQLMYAGLLTERGLSDRASQIQSPPDSMQGNGSTVPQKEIEPEKVLSQAPDGAKNAQAVFKNDDLLAVFG